MSIQGRMAATASLRHSAQNLIVLRYANLQFSTALAIIIARVPGGPDLRADAGFPKKTISHFNPKQTLNLRRANAEFPYKKFRDPEKKE